MILRGLARMEARLDRWFAARRAPVAAVIEPYIGYATPSAWVVRGRALARVKGRPIREGQGVLSNLRGMATFFATDEIAGIEVRAVDYGRSTTTDEEGYFTLTLPRGTGNGAAEVTVEADGREAMAPVIVPHPDAAYGIISDVDDTMLYTGAWNLARNLWTTFSSNAASRQVFPDAVRLMQRLSADGRNPVFCVSSSPWNLHGFLQEVLWGAGLVRGPLFLRDLGLNETNVLGRSHHGHKGAMIDLVLAANPSLDFVMIGDTGQKDGSVYLEAARRHPGRIRRVILRRAGLEPRREDVEGLGALGVPVEVVPDYDQLSG